MASNAQSTPIAWSNLTSSPLGWSSLALALGALLHIDRAPIWISAIVFALIGWRIAAAVRSIRLPGKFTLSLIAIILVGAIFTQFHTLNGLIAGTLLLLMMSAVKLLETHKRRDHYIVIGGTLFLLLAACLERQSLARTPLYVLEAWICCAALAVTAYSPGVFGNRQALLLAGRTLLYSLPLAILLFLVFPRLPGAFWALPRTDEAETGLSDKMSPGSISQLTSSYEIAFRVKFQGDPPPARERYWRGPVLHNFDGYTWSRALEPAYAHQPLEYLGATYHYRVTLEPSQQRWWFSLDTVDRAPDHRVFFGYDYELVAADPVTSLTTYDATSHTSTRPREPLTQLARRTETALPSNRNPRSRQFAQELRSHAASDGAFVDAVLEYLRTHGFVYSLTPPLLNYDSVDDFMFNTRSGFCGHYASAFVTLMRSAGVPARVVTGYLGGEWNPIGGYFIIRQSDAHSWAEVWLGDHGWVRVDPTAVVEPDRLTRGMLDLLPNAGDTEARLLRSSAAITSLFQRWDALNTWWNDRVLKFDYRSQLNMLQRLGISTPDASTLGWAFATVLIVWLGWIAWQFGRGPAQRRPDRLARAYERLCYKLARVGVPRSAHQGPLAYADSVSAHRPDLDNSVRALLTRYADLRYGRPAEAHPNAVALFERDVSRFRARST
jgi:protein-glutamine gamma-glutamyltransferase